MSGLRCKNCGHGAEIHGTHPFATGWLSAPQAEELERRHPFTCASCDACYPDRASTAEPESLRPCPDCGAAVGAVHQDGCDVARCLVCGGQRLFDEHEAEGGGEVWTGRWPGEAECEEFGWWAVWSKTVLIGGVPTGTGRCLPVAAGTPGAFPDLNRLGMAAARGEVWWDRERQRFVQSAKVTT